MRWDDIYLNAAAASLGSEKQTVEEAVAEGLYDAEESELDGYTSVRIAGPTQESAADMAVDAVNLALQRADINSDDIVLLAHGASGSQGLYYWQPASYIQKRTFRGSALATEVKQASNSGIVALELATSYLATRPAPAAVLVTTSEQYRMPHLDRYRSEKGQIRGDGATALVLSRGIGTGVARLVSTVTVGDSTHEGLYRGDQPWETHPGANGWPVDLRIRVKEYLMSGVPIESIAGTVGMNLYNVINTALAEADVNVDEVARFVFPHTGLTIMNWDVNKKELGIDVAKTTWDWGRGLGHMGGGDQAAGLTRLIETGAVHAGDYVAMVGIGGGFTFSCVVFQILADVDWTDSTS